MAEQIQAQAMHQSNLIRDSIKGLNEWVAEMKRKENDFAQVQPRRPNGSNERARNDIQAEEPNRAASTMQQSKAEKAHELKERGNGFVKRQEYEKAIRCYTAAIELHSTEPVFYSNRALCHLKKEDHRSCIGDCTQAISLDKTSVKAYFRRAKSYEHTCFFKEAAADFRSVLVYEPKNVEAKRGLDRIDKLQMEQEKSREAAKRLRQWSQHVHDPAFDQVAFVDGKPPHLRSKDPLTRVDVSESDANATPTVVEMEVSADATVQQEPKSVAEPIKANPSNESIVVAPQTTTQFHKAWLTAKDAEQKFKLLRVIGGANVTKLLGAQFNLDMLRDQCSIMEEYFLPRREPIANLLRGIVQNTEMKIIAFLMVDADKNRFHKLLQHAREIGENNEVVESTQAAFNKLFVL